MNFKKYKTDKSLQATLSDEYTVQKEVSFFAKKARNDKTEGFKKIYIQQLYSLIRGGQKSSVKLIEDKTESDNKLNNNESDDQFVNIARLFGGFGKNYSKRSPVPKDIDCVLKCLTLCTPCYWE